MKPQAFYALASWLSFAAVCGGEKREGFDGDPGWEGRNNRLKPAATQVVVEDFGWSATTHASRSRGEIGGKVWSSVRPAYYGKLVEEGTWEQGLSASGALAVDEAQSISGWHTQANIYVGWFSSDARDLIWRPRNFIGFRLQSSNEPDGAWVELTYGTSGWQAGGMFVNAAGGGQQKNVRELKSEALLRVPPDGSRHSWSFEYDPAGANGAGEMIFIFDGAQTRMPLRAALRKTGGKFNRFGIFSPRVPGRGMVAWFGDVRINGKKEDLSKDPGWEGLGNRARFVDDVEYGINNFGFSDSAYAGGKRGEVGGRLFSCNPSEEEFKAYYGDRVGPLSLEDRLSARGRFVAKEFCIDSSFALGWFNAAKQGWPIENFVGVHFDSLSTEGRIAAPLYGTVEGNKRGEAGQLVFEPGKQYEWALEYDPAGANGRGMISFTMGGKTVTGVLREGDKVKGAVLDRFGIMNMQWANSKWCEVYFDDLIYTSGR
jgi:hypothetical protein